MKASQEIPRILWNPKFRYCIHKSLPRLLNCTVTWKNFYGEELLAPRPKPKQEDHTFSAVRGCLFNIFAANFHIWRNLLHPQPEEAPCRGDRDLHITVTGTHLSLWQGPTYRGLNKRWIKCTTEKLDDIRTVATFAVGELQATTIFFSRIYHIKTHYSNLF